MATREAAEAEDVNSLLNGAAPSLPPPHVVHDLLSAGVCVQCIFRIFGVSGCAHLCSSITTSMLHTFLEEQSTDPNGSARNGWCSCASTDLEKDETYCSICLGVLQLACFQDQETRVIPKEARSIDAFISILAETVKQESFQIDGFSLEVSLPPVIAANERAIWLYMKRKYESEEWFKDKFSGQMSIKEALRVLLSTPLENHMNVKSGVHSFRVRLTYTHSEALRKLQDRLPNNRRRDLVTVNNGNNLADSHERTVRNGDNHSQSESDSVINRTLDSMSDHAFCELFQLPPAKAFKPCQLTITCCRVPIYIGGRYLKFSRRVSQSRWIIDDERMGEASVEELVGEKVCLICRGDDYKFHAAGREDIDVRMLGSGRPFLVEVTNSRSVPSVVGVQQITEEINNSEQKYVRVRNLKLVDSEAWALMREGEAEKQKQYAALVWISRPLMEDDLKNISSIKEMEILQRTPIRVLHRRSPLERKRVIHWMMVENITGSCQYFLLHLCTQAGTYIKEFVHGDLGRTHPSLGSILGCRAEILQLDVTDVKMDCFD
ncbi:putative tRNA pseudouridine synthase Pus10 [Ananas comosus]|uniref:tRNA pseudouridine(55) synthase n=1 Tax=Ananas comosus TaxID=4615 RepID=A0A199UG79_ANACO|nr:putative tRNA pseudouridine synthase Pus10 [Ananas comosus]